MLDLTSCPDKLVSALIEVLVTSVNKEYLAEAERLLAALHIMRPRFKELHVYDVWLLMGHKRYREATQVLRSLEAQSLRAPYDSYVSALMAICLCSLRDPGWRMFANEVLARNEDPDSVRLVGLLTGEAQATAAAAPAPTPAEKAALSEISPFSTNYFMRA